MLDGKVKFYKLLDLDIPTMKIVYNVRLISKQMQKEKDVYGFGKVYNKEE